jgi:hypothetical protein
MRRLVVSFLVIGCFARSASALPPEGASAAGKSAMSACSLLTKELVTKVSPEDKEALDLVMSIPPSEDPVGPSGSSCGYGGVNLQIDPFASPARIEKDLATQWTRVSGLGDIAYFRDNSGRWAELYVRAGARVLTIQMGVPTGRTAESIKPNSIALAKEILPKLK